VLNVAGWPARKWSALYEAPREQGAVPIRSLEGFERIALRRVRRNCGIHPDAAPALAAGRCRDRGGGKQPGFRGAADASTTQVLTANMTITP